MGAVVIVCCKLHNFIIDASGARVSAPTHMDEQSHQDGADVSVHLQNDCDTETWM